jgi:hypothetical protein
MAAGAARERAGIDRRSLIRRSAAVGVGAWTAPVILGSLTSPAAAVTLEPGCQFLVFNNQCSTNNQQSPCTEIEGCEPNAALADCLEITSNGTDCQQGVTVTVTNNCGDQCVITAAEAKSGDDCIPPNETLPQPTSVSWPPLTSPGYAQFSVFLTCT